MGNTINAKILAYSDIHFHDYNNEITIFDCRNVEEEIADAALINKCDAILFGGDRFLSRNPSSYVRSIADKSLVDMLSQDCPYIALAGNHDRLTKSSISDTAYYPKYVYPEAHKHFSCMTEITTTIACDANVNIVGIPAGHLTKYKHNKSPYKGIAIAMFHDMLNGSTYANGMTVSDCISPTMLDTTDFSLVLGGDNHKPQELNFTNTQGIYIGAPMAHNWGDANQKRGYWIIDLAFDGQRHVNELMFVESHAPKFIKTDKDVNSYNDIIEIIGSNATAWKSNVVRLTLNCSTSTLNALNINNIASSAMRNSGARLVDVIPNIIDQTRAGSIDISTASSDVQEWDMFIDGSQPLPDGLDLNEIRRLGKEFINDINDN